MILSAFLVEAKKRIYASEREYNVNADLSKESTIQFDDFIYKDHYYGFNPFAGQEMVYNAGEVPSFQQTPLWCMNYYGRILPSSTILSIDITDIYAFLREALLLVSEEKPFRGPSWHERGEFQYVNETEGSLDLFTGLERIFHQRQEVYHLNYHGGIIRAKLIT